MLNQKYFGLPLWVWLVVTGIVLYSYNQSCSKMESKTKSKDETKAKNEKFADIANIANSNTNANSNTKIKIFNFNTAWCGWSRRFQPEWNKFAEAVALDSKLKDKVEVIDVKCDNSDKESMCESYGVPGYPYVVAEINGQRTPYNGERTIQALLAFVSSK